ncbi:YbaB/EbfC family nucleoid-associated protein [Candidatus Woesebacteria bacterium]|nr:YbaB/EbfC family nucleoid-associated protein [Candidatus Woesebacteria bacterium]
MFDKLQQLNDLRKLKGQADELQKQLKTIILSHEKGGLRIKINGAQEFEYVELDGEQRDDIKDALNEAMKKVQKEAAKKMMEMGGGLSGLLGKM